MENDMIRRLERLEETVAALTQRIEMLEEDLEPELLAHLLAPLVWNELAWETQAGRYDA